MTLKNVISFCWKKCKKKKYGLAAILAAGCIVVTAIPVYASSADSSSGDGSEVFEIVDDEDIIHNEQQIDPATGNPISDDISDVSVSRISSNSYYNSEKGVFVYSFDDAGTLTVSSNVADGMYTNGIVSMEASEGITYRLYKNGYALSSPDISKIEDTGYYVLMISATGESDMASLGFRIIDKYTNVSDYDMPDGFSVLNVVKDGAVIQNSGDSVDLTEEGEYHINYVCDVTQLTYSLDTAVDHTAPTLALPEVNEKGYATSAVDISDREEGTTIFCTINNQDYTVTGTRLVQSGYYKLIIQDEAGNQSAYSFRIRVYFTFSLLILLFLLIAALAALIGYVIVTRKTFRVR